MIPTAALRRRLGPWLAGLFVVAQIFGVGALMSSHATHVAETEMALSADSATAGSVPHSRHYRGDADGLVQHHELQDLSGAFLSSVTRSDVVLMPAALTFEASQVLPDADPIRLERPPKTHLFA